jgi:cell division protein FtsB
MKRAKYLFTIFSATLAYVLVSITVGQNSIRCFNQMEEQRRIISKQTDDIQNINSELQLELTALQFDKAVIAAYARRLDYVSDDEKLVKITGLKPAQTALYDTGTVIRHEEPDFLPEKYCKMIGLLFGIMTFIILFLYDVNVGNISFDKNKKPIITGVPVYDLPQI